MKEEDKPPAFVLVNERKALGCSIIPRDKVDGGGTETEGRMVAEIEGGTATVYEATGPLLKALNWCTRSLRTVTNIGRAKK